MSNFRLTVLASGMVLGLSAPAFAFQCPSEIAKIDEALASADLSDEQKQQVMELRDEGQRLHEEGNHQQSLDTLAQATAILGLE